MSEFDSKYGKFVNTLQDPKLTVAQQLVLTAGKGSQTKKNYTPPTKVMINKTLELFKTLQAFDTDPTDETFATVQNALKTLEMKAVRVADAPEWIYITPDADPKKESAKWERISKSTQFDLSWHVGSNSKVGFSDEHNGTDGAFRVVSELVRQGDNFKLVMSNSRHRATSNRNASNRYIGDWAHSTATIDFPVMRMLAEQDFYIFNVHGMRGSSFGLLVNNRTSFFRKGQPSLPTFLGIALSKFFRDSNHKKFVFGGELPGSVLVDGKWKPLTAPNNQKESKDSLFIRAKGVHNTNKIGRLIHNVQAQKNKIDPAKYDSGHSCHIEFGAVRDGRDGLRKMVAAINLAAYWVNNYQPELEPWAVVKSHRNFDMTNYGDLYPQDEALNARLKEAGVDNTQTTAASVMRASDDQVDDIDLKSGTASDNDTDLLALDPEGDEEPAVTAPKVKTAAPAKPVKHDAKLLKSAKPLLLSRGPRPQSPSEDLIISRNLHSSINK